MVFRQPFIVILVNRQHQSDIRRQSPQERTGRFRILRDRDAIGIDIHLTCARSGDIDKLPESFRRRKISCFIIFQILSIAERLSRPRQIHPVEIIQFFHEPREHIKRHFRMSPAHPRADAMPAVKRTSIGNMNIDDFLDLIVEDRGKQPEEPGRPAGRYGRLIASVHNNWTVSVYPHAGQQVTPELSPGDSSDITDYTAKGWEETVRN